MGRGPDARPATSGAAPERVARVNLDAFRHNVRTLAALAAPAETMLAVKADAYGHGLTELATAALEAGATSLAVLDIPAALELRAAGFTVPIFAWMHAPNADFEGAVRGGIDLGVSAVWQLEGIAAARARVRVMGLAGSADRPGAADPVPQPTRVHLKIDTGLHRNGARPEDWPELVQTALAFEAAGELHLFAAWSHLADASPEDDSEALTRFRQAVAVAEGLGARFEKVHLAASSAGIRMPEARLDMVRFGIAAYGVSPFDDETALELGLRPVMTLVAPVVATKRVPAGHGVSYGFDYRTAVETTLALVPLGYADGVPRAASGRAEVWIDGRRYPVAGRIAMDQVVVDVGDAPVSAGDEVVLFGEAPARRAGRGAAGSDTVPTAEEWAGWAQTIGDEIVARVGPRVVRQYVGDGGAEGDESWVIDDPDAMHAFGVEFAGRLAAGDVLVLTGELGAGKTTFARGLGEGLGVRGAVTSPTFVLARTHPNAATGVALVHVDAYRLGSAAELDDLDIDFDTSIVVVEWGSGMIENLVDGYLELVIERPRGADDSPSDRAGGDSPSDASDDDSPSDASGDDSPSDASDDGAEPIEPRVVTLYRRERSAPRAVPADGDTHD